MPNVWLITTAAFREKKSKHEGVLTRGGEDGSRDRGFVVQNAAEDETSHDCELESELDG